MTYLKPIANAYVRAFLQQEFMLEKGWLLLPKPDAKKWYLDYILERKRPNGSDRILVKLKLTDKLSQFEVNRVNALARRHSGRYLRISRKLIFVPLGCDTSLATPNLEIIPIPRLVCEGGEIRAANI